MFYINLQLRVFVRTLSSRRLEKKDYPSILLLDYEIPRESSHNTKGDISVHKKKQSITEQQLYNKLLLRESSIPSIHCRGRSNKNKRDQTPTKKSPALFLKRASLYSSFSSFSSSSFKNRQKRRAFVLSPSRADSNKRAREREARVH
jgi:hypothetical protein